MLVTFHYHTAARMLKLVSDKYVLGLCWTLELSPALTIRRDDEALPGSGGEKSKKGPFLPCLAFLESLLSLIETQLQVGILMGVCI